MASFLFLQKTLVECRMSHSFQITEFFKEKIIFCLAFIKYVLICRFLVRVSYFEIYNEEIHDLLSKKSQNLEIKERPDVGVYVKDLSTFIVNNAEDMERIMMTGNRRSKLRHLKFFLENTNILKILNLFQESAPLLQ